MRRLWLACVAAGVNGMTVPAAKRDAVGKAAKQRTAREVAADAGTFSTATNLTSAAECTPTDPGFFSATGPNSAWDVDHNGITAVVGETSILSLSGAVSQKCFRCSAKKK